MNADEYVNRMNACFEDGVVVERKRIVSLLEWMKWEMPKDPDISTEIETNEHNDFLNRIISKLTAKE